MMKSIFTLFLLVVFAGVQVSAQETSKSADVLKLLYESKTDEAAELAATHLASLAESFLSDQPETQQVYTNELSFIQFTRVYKLGGIILAKLVPVDTADVKDDIAYAAACEMVGEQEKAMTAYATVLRKNPEHHGARRHLCFLLVDHRNLSEAEIVLNDFSPQTLIPVGQQIYNKMSTQQTLEKRLDYVELLVAYFERLDPKAHVPADWLPGMFDSQLGQGYYQNGFQIQELYTRHNYNYSYNNPEMEEKARQSIERRRKVHDALCRALIKLPQFATEGFKRLAALATKDGENQEAYSAMACNLLQLPPPPQRPADQPPRSTTNQQYFHENWVRFLSPAELLVKVAAEDNDFSNLKETVLPELEKAGKTDTLRFLRDMIALVEGDGTDFVSRAVKILETKYADIEPRSLVRQLFEMITTRNIEEDRGPLLISHFKQLAHLQYQSPGFVLEYAKERRKRGLPSYKSFLEEVAVAMIGPEEGRKDRIQELYQPNTFNLQSPGNVMRNYVAFLSQLAGDLELAAPALEKAFALNLIHPNDYQFQNNLDNSLSYYQFRRKLAKLYEFLQESPFLNPLDTFRGYPMRNISRSSVFGYLVYGLGRLSSSDRAKALAIIKNHQPDTFGKAMILAYLETKSTSTSVQRLALATEMENHIDAISKLPEDRQLDHFLWFRGLQGNSSSLSSTISTSAPKTSKWYAEMMKKPNSSSSRFQNRNNLPSVERFLQISKRSELAQPANLYNTTIQLLAPLASTDVPRAEKLIRKYIELASQPPPATNNGTAPQAQPNTEMVLSHLVNQNPKLKTIGLVLKLIHETGDPGKGVYPQLDNGIRAAMQTTDFSDIGEVAATLHTASGSRADHTLLTPYFCQRLATLKPTALQAYLTTRETSPEDNNYATELASCARLALLSHGQGDHDQAEKEFIARLRDSERSLSYRLRLLPAVGNLAVKGEAWSLTNACLDLLRSAWADKDTVVPLQTPARLLTALADAKENDEKENATKSLLELWSQNSRATPMTVDMIRRIIPLASKMNFSIRSLLEALSGNVQQQPGFLALLLRNDAQAQAARTLPWSFLAMPPINQSHSNTGRSIRTVNGVRLVEQTGRKNRTLPRLNLGQEIYDPEMHGKLPAFLGMIEDPGQRFFAEFLITALPDGPNNPPEFTNQIDRLIALAKRFDRSIFTSPYLAEHTLSWLTVAVGVTDGLRDDVAHFGRQLDYQLVTQWSDGSLKTSRQGLLNRFLQDASQNDPEAFATILIPILEKLGPDNYQTRQLLDAYCRDFPQKVLQDAASLTPEKAARYLPLLKKLGAISNNTYWSGRDQCVNANLVLHMLANQMDGYKKWTEELDNNTRVNIEHQIGIDQIIALLQNSLSNENTSKERRLEILNVLFAASSFSRNSSFKEDEVYQNMVELKVITKDDILTYGSQWAETNARNGAAYGELAKYQAEAGHNEEAILSYLQAVVHAPMDNNRLYTQYHLEKAKLLLAMDRIEAAISWFDFFQPGRMDSNKKDDFEKLRRDTRMRYLTEPSRTETSINRIRQTLEGDPTSTETWLDLAENLIAHGNHSLENADHNRGVNLLKLGYYIQLQLRKSGHDLDASEIQMTRQDLTRGLNAIGQKHERRDFIGKNSPWQYYYAKDGINGSSWRNTISLSEGTGWKEGIAPLGYGDGDETTVLDYGKDKDNKPITAYFRKTFEMEVAGEFNQLSLGILHDDGMIVYLNGREIARNNMPSGSAKPDTLAPKSRSNNEENDFWETTVSSSRFNTGTNILAIEVHQNRASSSDLGFDLELYSEALDESKVARDVEEGSVIEALPDWSKNLPENIVNLARALAETKAQKGLAR